MIAQKNVTHMYVGANAAVVTTGAPSTARYLGFKVLGETACQSTALAAGNAFQVLYYDKNSKLVVSPVFYWSNVIDKRKVAYAAPTYQVSSIGYTGVSGNTSDIVETDSGVYRVTIGYKDSLKMIGNKRLFKYGEYQAGTTAHKYDIALGLAANLQLNLASEPYQRVKPSMVMSTAHTAANDFVNTVTVVKGSQYITVGTNCNYATSTALAVGDFVRLSVDGTTVTSVASNTYRVIELTSTTVFKVDRPVVEDSWSGNTAETTEVIASATGVTAYFGIRLTANDTAKPFEIGKWNWDVIRFDVGVSTDFGATPVTLITKPSNGLGTYKEIANIEWELLGNRREAYRIAEYPLDINSSLGATSGETYTVYTIRFKENSTETIGGTADSCVTLMIASAGATLTSSLDTLFTVS